MARILVVDDDVALRALMVRALLRAGHDAVDVGTVAQALTLRDQPFQLLVVDHRLPDGTGQDVLAAFPAVPAVRVSGFSIYADLHKPFTNDQLIEAVHHRLGMRSSRAFPEES